MASPANSRKWTRWSRTCRSSARWSTSRPTTTRRTSAEEAAVSYETLAHIAQTWGTVGFVVMFALVLVYALNPKNRTQFDAAAKMPLEKD
ncbi:hypothetical protein SLNSH_00310 [Alsobacter soli]|uniref:CcoQ/FixQ family Cbb3-type cytochrome c oxidase assembly chaperone n=1 Tax=Alsobacter soli TaxID=2109933 RepID=A0A2T1HYU4_9HYPH|nr:hypothetical protein SLNSH_00310 [Alsobacter soli]